MRRQKMTMEGVGVSKTVYSLVYPETRDVLESVLESSAVHEACERPYTKRQDDMHLPFFKGFEDWCKPVLDLDGANFPERYPSSGSSEAIRETIAWHGSTRRDQNLEPTIHVFRGEYEGYSAYAGAHGIRVITHERDNFDRSLERTYVPGDRFYISQPSGIDGNIWGDYDGFMQWVDANAPELKVMLDLAYLGTVPNQAQPINATHPNISGIFMSTSKTFGTYYHRIGGMFSKEEIPGLWGNRWFKSLPALISGTELMKRFKPGELPEKYLKERTEVIEELRRQLGPSLRPSDVFLIATQPKGWEDNELKKSLYREDLIRYCLTPAIDRAIQPGMIIRLVKRFHKLGRSVRRSIRRAA